MGVRQDRTDLVGLVRSCGTSNSSTENVSAVEIRIQLSERVVLGGNSRWTMTSGNPERTTRSCR